MFKFLNLFSKDTVPFGKFIFAPLFYSCFHVFHFVHDVDFKLHSIASRFIGAATLADYNIESRVHTFYYALLILALTFLGLAATFNWLIRKKIIAQNELMIFNVTSFCGLVLLYFRATGSETYSSINFLFAIHAALIVVIASRNLRGSKIQNEDIDIHFFSWVVVVAFCVLFLTVKMLAHFGITKDFSFTIFLTATVIALNFIFNSSKRSSNSDLKIHRWSDALSFLAWGPLLSVLSDEAYMVLNQRNIHLASAGTIFLAFFLLIAVWKISAKRIKSNVVSAEVSEILFSKYFPALVLGITTLALYKPIFPASKEMFETANGVLPVQQFFEFGKIPLADIFSSHILSDFFFNYVYVFLNGYENFCFYAYDFIIDVAAVLITYYFIREISGSGYWAFFTAVFYPLTVNLVPPYVCFALLPLLAYIQTARSPSTKNYFSFFSFLFLLILWRMDLGFAVLLSTTAVMLFLSFQKSNTWVASSNFFRGMLLALIPWAILSLILIILRGRDLFQSIRSALDYFSSAQSYGHVNLFSGSENIYDILYVVFPFVVLLLAGYALYIFHSKEEFKIRLLCISLLYLAVYYFANFQRGLVRHGLNEFWDVPTTSFAFLIIFIGMLICFSDKTAIVKFFWLTVITTLIISRYKFPETDLGVNNFYHSAYLKMKHVQVIKSSAEKINRMPAENDFAGEHYSALKKFMDDYLKPEETFADFSNTPMLYYYLHRKNPHYFSQSPLSYHSVHLQEKYIEEIKTSNPKLLLFSNHPLTWFDNTDGVPNSLRHYRAAEYIFENYRPAYVLNKSRMWLRNDLPLPPCECAPDTFSRAPQEFNLASLAYLWGKFDRGFKNIKSALLQTVSVKQEVFAKNTEKRFHFLPVTEKQAGNYVLIRASRIQGDKTEILMTYGKDEKKSGGFIFLLPEAGTNDYIIRISSQYNWFAEENNWLSIYPMGSDVTIEKISILKGD